MAYIGNQVTSIPFTTDTFSGTGGQTAFTLTRAPAVPASIAVFISGAYQAPAAYSLNGVTLNFASAPSSGTNNIVVLHLSTGTLVQVPADGSVTLATLSGDTYSYINSAFAAANSASPATASSYANSAFLAANTPSHVANSAASYANSGLIIANSAASYANSGFAAANTADAKGTSAGSYANSAFTRANNSINANTGGTITGDLTVTNNASFYGPIIEKANVVTTGGLTANLTISTSESGVLVYTTNSSANAAINFTGLGSAPVGNVFSYVVMVPNGATARYIQYVEIDGTAITPKWGGGFPTGGTAANTDIYSFNIVKTSATPTYNVFAQVSNFF